MDKQPILQNRRELNAGKLSRERQPASKWQASVNDVNVYAAERHTSARMLKEQAEVPEEHVLVRDHGSDHDVALAADATVDLAEGNVFFTLPACDYRRKTGNPAPAKRAFFCDDRPFTTLRADQTGKTLRDLFGLPAGARLFRNDQTPADPLVDPDNAVHFKDGPVFYSRPAEEPCPPRETDIIVNGRRKVYLEPTISYGQIVRLAFERIEENAVYTVTYKRGDPRKPEGSMVEGDVVTVKCGEIFNVTCTRKS